MYNAAWAKDTYGERSQLQDLLTGDTSEEVEHQAYFYSLFLW